MKKLIQRALEKNQDAYSEIYELTYNKVAFTIRMLLKDDSAVDDILQETYITAFEKLETLKEPEKINAWICKIARNKTIDYLRKRKEIAFLNVPIENNQSNLEEIDLPEERVEFIPEKKMDNSENSRLLMDILNNLPYEQRICVIAFYYEQRSIKEIAEEVNCNEETVKSRIRYAKKKIKEQVEELKKTGTYLYGVAPIPFFVWLLKDAGESFRYSGGVTGIQVATSSMASSFPAKTATIEMEKMSSAATAKDIAQGTAKVVLNGKKAGSFAMKWKALTVGQKIAAGLASASVTVGAIGGGVAGYQHLQANAIVAENTEEEAEVKTEDIEISQAVEATETEEVETEELVIEYVSLLDQIGQLTPSDAVEVLRQYCENGTYGEGEYLTVELENGATKTSYCNEFGFLNAVLFSRGVISEDSYYDAQSWREPSEELLELLEANNYMKGDCAEDVCEGSILVSNLENEDIAFYVNSVQDEVYELLYWDEGMLALEQDFPMDAMYRTAEQMEYMLSSDYTLYSYGKVNSIGLGTWKIDFVFDNGVVIDIMDSEYGVWAVEYSTEKNLDEYKFVSEMHIMNKICRHEYKDDKKEKYRGKILLEGLESDTTYYIRLYLANALNGKDIKSIESEPLRVHTKSNNMKLKKGTYSCMCSSTYTEQIVKGFGHDCAGVSDGKIMGNVLYLNGSIAEYNPETWECSNYSEYKSHYYWISDNVELWFEYHDEYDEGIEEIEVDDFNRYLSNGWVQLVITSDGEQITKLKIIWMP